MNKYPKEFLIRIAEKVEGPIKKTYILCIDHLLEYDFEYLKKSGIIQLDFYRAMKIVAEAARNYDDVKEVFDSIVEDVKKRGDYSEYFRLMEEIIFILIKEDKDKYEEHILNKLFGNAWKDPDFFLPEKDFLRLPDRFPALEDLLFRNTTFSDNLSEELSKKIINGLKILSETVPGFIERSFYYRRALTSSDCAVTKYLKQNLELKRSCKMENVIAVKILKNHIQITKYIFLKVKRKKYRDYLAEKIAQYVSKIKIPDMFVVKFDHEQELSIQKVEYINLPTNFSL